MRRCTVAKVVSLTGEMPQPGEPSQKLIAFLKDQLERAEAGRTIGFAGAILEADREAVYYVAGHTGGFTMVGALTCALQKLTAIASGDR